MNSKDIIYLTDVKKIIPFVPEKKPSVIAMTKQIYEKYFIQNELIDYTKLKISNIGKYSIAIPELSLDICQHIIRISGSADLNVTDALANVGGMTLRFCQFFKSVNSCELIPLHATILKNNIEVYGYAKKVKVINDDYMNVMKKIKQDIIFFDPPWGGTDYKEKEFLSLGINNVNIITIINELVPHAKYIFLLAPSNYSPFELLKIKNDFQVIHLIKGKYLICVKGDKS